ncbi:MAG: redoxin family protein [Rhodobacteraceae bacterium]|nr:redoxin family protein [Paracoccaceae bacterium]
MSNMLTPDTPVPGLSVETVGGNRWELSAQQPENFTMVVFYRGLHCPVCKSYLQKLEGLLKDYEAVGISTIAISMNDKALAEQAASEWELGDLKLGYGLSEDDARAWGLYISKAFKDVEADIFCEPGLFWVRPDGRLYLVDVSNMPWARPDLEFLVSKVTYALENDYPARGGH